MYVSFFFFSKCYTKIVRLLTIKKLTWFVIQLARGRGVISNSQNRRTTRKRMTIVIVVTLHTLHAQLWFFCLLLGATAPRGLIWIIISRRPYIMYTGTRLRPVCGIKPSHWIHIIIIFSPTTVIHRTYYSICNLIKQSTFQSFR